MECEGCISAGDNFGTGKVFRINISNGNVIATTEFGDLHAFDLQMGICNTSDGGYGVVSTKRPTTGYDTFVCDNTTFDKKYWFTDAYVAKVDQNDYIEWEGTIPYDEDEAPEVYPGDFKKQECLYSISLGPDDAFVLGGNNSNNFDDNYLIKLFPDCQIKYPYDYFTSNPDLDFYFPANNELWNGVTKTIRSTIIVEDGVTFTIRNSTLEFADKRQLYEKDFLSPPYAQPLIHNFIVEPGGKLVIFGSRLRGLSDCPASNMWEGITILGYPNLTSDNSGQTKVEIEETTIENAMFGIAASNSIYLEGERLSMSSTQGGAKVLLDDVDFLNCKWGCYFGAYNKLNKSRIENCTFDCTSFLADPTLLDAEGIRMGSQRHLEVEASHGVTIERNDFKNTAGENQLLLPAKWPYGIYGKYAGMNIRNQNRFNYQTIGIFINADAAFYGNHITGNSFDNNAGGIRIENNMYPVVAQNSFLVGPSGESCIVFGAVLSNCTGYSVEENVFTRNSNVFSNWGLVLMNSSSDANEVYNNEFTDFMFGTQAQQDNSGLQIKCNQYESSTQSSDIIVPLGSINPFQGTCIQLNQKSPAGNTFSHTEWDIVEGVSVPNVIYSHHNSSVTTPVQYSNNVFPQQCPLSFVRAEACPVKYSADCDIPCKKALIGVFEKDAELLISQIDGGITSRLLGTIEFGTDTEVRDELMGQSPFLSDEVLLAAIARTSQLPDSILREIMIANSSLTAQVWDALEALVLPKAVMDSIELFQNGTSPRLQLENMISYNYSQKDIATNELLREYFKAYSDSNWQDSAIQILISDPRPLATVKIIRLLFAMQEYTFADSMISVLASKSEDYTNFIALYDTLIYISLNDTLPYPAVIKSNPSLIEFVTAIAMDSSAYGFADARSVLELSTGQSIRDEILIIDFPQERRSANLSEAKPAESLSQDLFLVFPNPAKNIINVKSLVLEKSLLTLVDLSGRVLISREISAGENYSTIDLNEFGSGIYFLSLEQKGSPRII